jgi:aldose 1-epimerase
MGAVLAWTWEGRDLLRPAQEESAASGDPLGVACFVMAPWVSRVAENAFRFQGARHALRPQSDPRLAGCAIHGEVWYAHWTLADHGPAHAVLRTRSRQGPLAWPWPYEAEYGIAVTPPGLEMTLSLRNIGVAPFPYALGFHPYFPRHGEVRLSARTGARSVMTADGLATGWEAPGPRWSGEALTYGEEDHCYAHWPGVAVLEYPRAGYRLRIAADGCSFLQVYAPKEDFVCVEPQSAGPGVLNHGPDFGVRILEPGSEDRIGVVLTPERL